MLLEFKNENKLKIKSVLKFDIKLENLRRDNFLYF